MPPTTIASCGNCGAALRLPSQPTSVVTCEYCHVDSVVHGQISPEAPALRVEPAKPPGKGTVWLVVTILVVLVAVAAFVERATTDHGSWSVSVVMSIVAAAFGLVMVAVRRNRATWDRMQAEGKPGRATVKAIRAGTGRHATLELVIETLGDPPRVLQHSATIPELLVPRVVEGLTIPVLVDPRAPDHVEIQWHLV